MLALVMSLSMLMPVSAQANTAAGETNAEDDPEAASYASEYSVSLAEAQRRLDRIPALALITEKLHGLEAQRLAGWGIDHQGPMTAWVWLVGDEPPNTAAAAIAAQHDDVQIRTGAAVTFAALTAAQVRFGFGEAVGAVANTGAADGESSRFSDLVTHTDVDLRANALEIGIDRARIRPADVPGGLETGGAFGPFGSTGGNADSTVTLSALRDLLAPHIALPYNVVAADPVENQAAFEGGRRTTSEVIENGKRKEHYCTSGFTARRRTTNTAGETISQYGIITAGHCKSTTVKVGVVETHTTETQGADLRLEKRAWNGWVDAAFYSIPTARSHTVTNRVRCSTNPDPVRTCTIDSVGPGRLLMMDHPVCHTGINSGYSCGRVTSVQHRPNITDGCGENKAACRGVFVRASGRDMRSCAGDSGGPVFRRTAAYGIHNGGRRGNGCDAANSSIYFSGVRRVQAVLGVSVVTRWPSDVL
ncbi:trypsin-like serine protease [Candidatus Poriferisodalis sp.]|uniref:trypsin-like serine protease n=1 Tax=Candidatus Poriferisodalis sp. TaxID=3101277 RepID=UPI003B02E56C